MVSILYFFLLFLWCSWATHHLYCLFCISSFCWMLLLGKIYILPMAGQTHYIYYTTHTKDWDWPRRDVRKSLTYLKNCLCDNFFQWNVHFVQLQLLVSKVVDIADLSLTKGNFMWMWLLLWLFRVSPTKCCTPSKWGLHVL